MARVVVKIEGGRETVRNINAFEMKKKQDAANVVKQHAKNVRTAAKKRVPVSPANRKKSSGRPGDLKRSIGYRTFNDGLSAVIYPKKKKAPHRHLVEYGTGPRYQKKSGRYVGRMSAQPFMEPAERSQEASYNNAMKKVFEGDRTEV